MIRKLCVLALFVLTWSFYSWTARADGKPFHFEAVTRDYYNLLVDGFLQGHLYLPVTPDPWLLQAADPYDPDENATHRMHDLSFYRGKYYLYFGASPAVSLLLPFRLIADLRLPENCAVAVFLFAGLIVSYRTFQYILQRFAPATPGYFSVIAVVLFGYCNCAPFLLRRPFFYELAIASAYCYYSASVYFLVRGLNEDRGRWWRLGLAGVLLGLTLGARPNYLSAALVAVLAVCAVSLLETKSFRTSFRRIFAVCLPLGFVVALLLTYNYLRFENIFEFGQRYQLGGLRIGKPFFSAAYFDHNFTAYMASPSRIDRHFPFFHLRPQQALVYSIPYAEPIGGALGTVPLTGLMLLLPLAWIGIWRGWRNAGRLKPLVVLATLFSVSGLAMVTLLSFNGGLTERYVADFIPSFLFSSLLVWIVLYHSLTLPYRRALNVLLILLLAFGVSLNLAVSLTGYYDNLLEANPAAYQEIRSWFAFIEKS